MPEPVKRTKLPGASELFRPTGASTPTTDETLATGRVRHDEKITVYFSSDELMRLEEARLALRRHHKVAVDRGRIVRAAVGLALADLAERGEDSDLFGSLQQ